MVLLRKRLGVTGTDFSFDHNPEDSLVQMTGFEEGSENDSFALDAWLFQQVRFSQVLPVPQSYYVCLVSVKKTHTTLQSMMNDKLSKQRF